MRSIAVCAAALSLAAAPAFAVAEGPPSAEAFYRHALEQTRDHLEPAFATYQARVDGIDCSIEDGNGLACRLKLFDSSHVTTKEPFDVSYRSVDDQLAMAQQGRSFVVGTAPFLNATWQGVDDLIRYGFVGKPAPKPQPSPSIDAQSGLPVIAVVSSLSYENYRIEDEGTAACSTGDPGHMVHLIALHDPLRYPVTDATVNMRTGDLCMVRFSAHQNAIAGLVGANGVAELDLADQNGFVMVRDERIDINLRTVGIAIKHLSFGIAFSGYAFPSRISPVVFATPEPSPSPSPSAVPSKTGP